MKGWIVQLWPAIPENDRRVFQERLLTENHLGVRIALAGSALIFFGYLIQHMLAPGSNSIANPWNAAWYARIYFVLISWSLFSLLLLTLTFERLSRKLDSALQMVSTWAVLFLCGALTALNLITMKDYTPLTAASLALALFWRSNLPRYAAVFAITPAATIALLVTMGGKPALDTVFPIFVFCFIAFLAALFLEGYRRRNFLLQTELQELALRDPMTGLSNRRFLEESIPRLAALKRREKTPACCIVFDIDRFRSVNEDFGYIAGDAALTAIARSVQKTVRESDLLARSGGDEFILILSDTSVANAIEIAERVRENVLSLAHPAIGRQLTLSGGIAELGEKDSPQEWIKKAERKLSAAKQAGRNRIEA